MFRLGVVVLSFFLAGSASAQQILAANSGESGPATAGQVEFLQNSSECYDGGACVRFTVAGGRTQQSALIEKQASAGGTVYVRARFKFPQGYTWDSPDAAQSTEHKLVIVNRGGNNTGRVLLNLRGGGTTPVLQLHFERLSEPADRGFTDVAWPADGQWHLLELLVEPGRGRVWLDGRLATDQSRATCGSPCESVRDVQVGAYVNQGAVRTQRFLIDDVAIATGRGAASTPPANPPPPAEGPDLVLLRAKLAEAAEALADALDELEAAQ